ncbi:MAG: hypothetical protein WAV20_12270 [Blastocatellia bacterium]
MRVRTVANILYALFGFVFVITGAGIMLLHTGLLPDTARDLILDIGHRDPTAIHLIQEFGSLMVFAGLITLWFIRHYEQSRVFHWAMTTFWALFALAHWFDGRERGPGIGPLITTIPFILFLFVGVLRTGFEKRRSFEAS